MVVEELKQIRNYARVDPPHSTASIAVSKLACAEAIAPVTVVISFLTFKGPSTAGSYISLFDQRILKITQ